MSLPDGSADDSRAALAISGKSTLCPCGPSAAASTTGPLVAEMSHEVAQDATELCVRGAAHWIAEEDPQAFVDGLLDFLGSARWSRTKQNARLGAGVGYERDAD